MKTVLTINDYKVEEEQEILDLLNKNKDQLLGVRIKDERGNKYKAVVSKGKYISIELW